MRPGIDNCGILGIALLACRCGGRQHGNGIELRFDRGILLAVNNTPGNEVVYPSFIM